METETIKTILVCINTIEKSREILAETLEKVEKFHFDELTESGRFDIHGLDIACERIKEDLFCASNNTESMIESLTANDAQEIDDAVLMVEDILSDGETTATLQTPKEFDPHSMADIAKAAKLGAGAAFQPVIEADGLTQCPFCDKFDTTNEGFCGSCGKMVEPPAA